MARRHWTGAHLDPERKEEGEEEGIRVPYRVLNVE